MKRLRLLAGVVMLAMGIVLWQAVPAQAHVLKQSNGVGAVLHIAPDDDPVAGELTSIGLDFSSSVAGFNLDRYAVAVSIEGTSVTASTPPVSLQPDGSASLYGVAKVTFPSPGAYNIVVRGTPYTGVTEGQAFTLKYEVRAERPRQPGVAGVVNSSGFDSIMLGLLSFGALGVIANYQISQGGRYRSK